MPESLEGVKAQRRAGRNRRGLRWKQRERFFAALRMTTTLVVTLSGAKGLG